MNRCKYCGKPLTLTPEFDTCMECQGRIMREATMPQNSFTTNSTKSNRNIYDEAIKEVKKLWNGNPLTYPEHIIKSLERAKKEHELLEWYRESWKTMRDGCLESKINKLEKELENEKK